MSTPDLGEAVRRHIESIAGRDIEAFRAHLTNSETLYTIVQDGHAFTTRDELVAIHEQWFKDPDWTWEGELVHQVVGSDVAMALIKYQYRARPTVEAFSTWLVYVFRLEGGEWRIVHDQNTAVDFAAFARSAGLSPA